MLLILFILLMFMFIWYYIEYIYYKLFCFLFKFLRVLNLMNLKCNFSCKIILIKDKIRSSWLKF